ncbi:hypothetical protein [Pseudomonas syringae]|uniref:hypothetical protein n=2 Tax=Pseudomonas syringae TaxID=317 RepID=UPI000E32A6F7|nr:hypothetical protein [Pseudomonas syringae]
MKTGRLIWTGFLLSTLAVAIWSTSLNSDGFFKVSNLHDFFDIIGSIATVFAVMLAINGLNHWKTQVGATSDHELARRMIVALLRYRNELLDLWQTAEVASGQNEARHWIKGEDDYSKLIYDHAVTRSKNAKAELEAISLEAKAIWGGIFKTGLTEAFKFDNICANTISNYTYLCKLQTSEAELKETSKLSVKSWNDFNHRESLSIETVEEKIDLLLLPVKIEIEKKLLRA